MNQLLDTRVERRARPEFDRLPDPPRRQPTAHVASSSVMLLPVRLFLAAGWLRAGAEKLIDRQWWTGAKLQGFLTEQHDLAIPFFRPVMDQAIAPFAGFVAAVVVITQLLCGLAIGTGFKMRLALRWAFLLNVTFILAGRVNPSCFYLVMETVLLFALADGTLGNKHRTPSGRSFIAAGVSVALAGVFVPYIRTIEPAKVIEDPAMMLTFLGAVLAATFIARRAAHPEFSYSRLGRLWNGRLAAWSTASSRVTGRAAPQLDRLNYHFLLERSSGADGWPPPTRSLPVSTARPAAMRTVPNFRHAPAHQN